ncbi:MAG: hypothetical protein V1731_01180 [Candidatus Aenigmatarchaeota archaeon]
MFDIFKAIGGLNPFKKKSAPVTNAYSQTSGAYTPPSTYSQSYPSAAQAPFSQNYPQPSPAPQYPSQAYPPPYQQPADDSMKTKINLVLSEIDVLKSQMQALDAKLSAMDEYFRQNRAMR